MRAKLTLAAAFISLTLGVGLFVVLALGPGGDGWKTYRSETYGYLVRYPASWQIEVRDPKPGDDIETQSVDLGNASAADRSAGVLVAVNFQGDWCTGAGPHEERQVVIAGVSGEESVCRDGRSEQRVRHFKDAKGKLSYTVLGSSLDQHAVVKQIVESFRFTK